MGPIAIVHTELVSKAKDYHWDKESITSAKDICSRWITELGSAWVLLFFEVKDHLCAYMPLYKAGSRPPENIPPDLQIGIAYGLQPSVSSYPLTPIEADNFKRKAAREAAWSQKAWYSIIAGAKQKVEDMTYPDIQVDIDLVAGMRKMLQRDMEFFKETKGYDPIESIRLIEDLQHEVDKTSGFAALQKKAHHFNITVDDLKGMFEGTLAATFVKTYERYLEVKKSMQGLVHMKFAGVTSGSSVLLIDIVPAKDDQKNREIAENAAKDLSKILQAANELQTDGDINDKIDGFIESTELEEVQAVKMLQAVMHVFPDSSNQYTAVTIECLASKAPLKFERKTKENFESTRRLMKKNLEFKDAVISGELGEWATWKDEVPRFKIKVPGRSPVTIQYEDSKILKDEVRARIGQEVTITRRKEGISWKFVQWGKAGT